MRTAGVEEGRRRVIIEGVAPEVDCGRFPAKRVVGDDVVVEADAFTDGHDAITVVLLHRSEAEQGWREVPMSPLVNDRWQASFQVGELGRYRYTVEAWVDPFKTWRRDLVKRVEARQDVEIDLRIGAEIVRAAAARADGSYRELLTERAEALEGGTAPQHQRVEMALDADLDSWMARWPDRTAASRYARELELLVDPERARFSTWYEFFPRSTAAVPGRHGTLRDAESRLQDIAEMGFDVVYLPPIHPIGRTKRKGRNNAVTAEEGEVGSPWAIGAEEGGHKSVHPDLGTEADLVRFVEKARQLGIEIALDIAFQVSPDHPYVKEHPEWFRHRPDGTIQFAENPPKKYEDIYPFDFESDAWRELWAELLSVVEHWVERGVRIFRVDNPHTKPFPLWEWLIGEVKRRHPEVIFLGEAFTRPKVMYRLAKLGFTQSYTYFSWRYSKWDFETYLRELVRPPVHDFFRPNFWPNTPDILTEQLQSGSRPVYIQRLVLAATLASNYGIYGPPFELMESRPRHAGSEEYLDSEKYQVREWDHDRPGNLRELIGRVNGIRRRHPALQQNATLRFHRIDNDQLLLYSKHTADLSNIILVAVNLDGFNTQGGWLEFPYWDFGIADEESYQVHDLLSGARYMWHGARNFVQLDPHVIPAHIFQIRRRLRSETDFDYY